MIDEFTQLHDSEEVRRLLQDVDTSRLARDLGAGGDQNSNLQGSVAPAAVVARLRVAAYLSLSQALSDGDVDGLLKQTVNVQERAALAERLLSPFLKSVGYLDALLEAGERPTIGDLLFYATAGFIARKPTEVRALLRRPAVREGVKAEMASAGELPWASRVRTTISAALLHLIRQEDHADLRAARDLMRKLADDQKEIEAAWIETNDNPRRDALSLLGLYHLAQAAILMSDFLLSGSVSIDGRTLLDFGPELRRLAIKAEEYLALAGDPDTLFWLNAIALLLQQIRLDSIWVNGRGISERIDRLLEEIAGEGRQNPIFSLMPSQQDALGKRLLDRASVAVVLQMPTSAGKTLLAEFSILQAFEAYSDARVVYVTPTRALATQIRRTLSEDLRPLGVQVSAAGSAFEEDPFELNLIGSSDGIVVSTPEKLDLLLRTHPEWFDRLRLVVVDEAHLLRDKERGVRLELLLANIRREQPQARLLLLTPFIQNALDIATWLGEAKGVAVDVHWRPSRILLGLARVAGSGSNRAITVEWKDPYKAPISTAQPPKTLHIPTDVPYSRVQSNLDRIVYLAERFKGLGTVLAMFIASRDDAEEAARRVSETYDVLPDADRTPALNVALALARNEYGPNSVLARCLERGVAFHHAALSNILRYLVEDQVRCGTLRFIAATTTLAQGMNFPVATVLVHSVSKPRGGGNLSPSEFWNIAGRAGRVGMADKGLVIFADHNHRSLWEYYSSQLVEPLESALLHALTQVNPSLAIEQQYKDYPELRPFLQYLAHAAALFGPAAASRNLDELLQASLANVQVRSALSAQKLRRVAQLYLQRISGKPIGYLKTVDSTGLGSFSFDNLFARIGSNPILSGGPHEILSRGQSGLFPLVDALRWLPEMDLAIGFGSGDMNVDAVARVVQGWIDGQPVHQLAPEFPGDDEGKKVQKAAIYIYGKISQAISWGAHAYIRGWAMRNLREGQALSPADAMLPSYIQYGVHTPEAAVASLLSVPRELSESFGAAYREQHGPLSPEDAPAFREFMESADRAAWSRVVGESPLVSSVDPDDVMSVWRQMQGLPS